MCYLFSSEQSLWTNLWAVVSRGERELMLVCVVPLMKVEGYIGEFSGSLVGLEPGGVVTGWNSILKLNSMFIVSLDFNHTWRIGVYNYLMRLSIPQI